MPPEATMIDAIYCALVVAAGVVGFAAGRRNEQQHVVRFMRELDAKAGYRLDTLHRTAGMILNGMHRR
jgi:hypothetical protein